MLQSQYVTIDGKRIHYLSKEPSAALGREPSAQLGKELTSDNTLFVLFHGFPENAHAWEAFIRTLSLIHI